MKKLMTVFASAAALCALNAAKAGTPTTTGFETAAYVAGQALDTTKDDEGNTAGPTYGATWCPTNTEDTAIVTAYGSDGAATTAEVTPIAGGKNIGDNYLKLDGAPLISRYAQTGGEALNIGEGLYIDTLVQFSATDPESVPTTSDGDKLCIWLKDNEADQTQCTLMIGAGFVDDDDGNIVQTNYTTTLTSLANNSWHRLQVKVLSLITGDEGALGDGFVILIDGTAVGTTTNPFNDSIDPADLGGFTARAEKYIDTDHGTYYIFPSIVKLGDEGSGTITALSFSGTGAIDNLEFSQGADIDPIEVTIPTAVLGLVADGTPKTGVTYDGDLEGSAFELDGDNPQQTEAGEYTTTFKLYVGYAWVGGSTADYDVDWSIAAGSGGGDFDGGDGSKFSIDAATQTELEKVLPTGKKLTDTADAASGMTYAQAYALGLLDEETGDVEELEATIEIVNGKVKVSLNDATATTKYVVTLKVYEKTSLSADWPVEATQTYELGSSTEAAGFTPSSATAGFYKVAVSIGDGTSN